MNNKNLAIHVASEVVLIGAITIYFHGQIKSLKKEVDALKKELKDLKGFKDQTVHHVNFIYNKLGITSSPPPSSPSERSPSPPKEEGGNMKTNKVRQNVGRPESYGKPSRNPPQPTQSTQNKTTQSRYKQQVKQPSRVEEKKPTKESTKESKEAKIEVIEEDESEEDDDVEEDDDNDEEQNDEDLDEELKDEYSQMEKDGEEGDDEDDLPELLPANETEPSSSRSGGGEKKPKGGVQFLSEDDIKNTKTKKIGSKK